MERYSASRLKTFDNCKLQYKLRYLDKVELTNKFSPDTEFGSYFHKVAEIYDGLNDNILSEVEKEYRLEGEFQFLSSIVFSNFKRFYEKYKSYKTANELELEYKDNKYWFYAILDRQMLKDNRTLICDYKTCKTAVRSRYLFQMKFYNLIYSKLFNIQPEQIEHIIYYPRPNFEDNFRFKNKDIEKFNNELIEKIGVIESNTEWEPTLNFLCKYCNYQNTLFCSI